jgi:hypothetical protein
VRTSGLFDQVNLADLGGIVHLRPEEYDRLIEAHGNSCEYRRAMLCPCRRIDAGTPALGCKHCRGLGYLYPPSMRMPMILLDVSRSGNLKLVAAGLVAQGQISLTFPRGFLPGRGDIVLPDGDLHLVQEQLWRGGTRRVPREALREDREPGAVPLVQRPRLERLLYPCEVQIEAVYYIAGENLHCARPSEYTLTDDNRWTWREGFGPEEGEAWSIRYRAPAAYMVENASPVFRHEADEGCPYRVEAKRLDRLGPDDLR